MRLCSYNMLNFEGYPFEPTIAYLGGKSDEKRAKFFANVIRGLECDIIGVQESFSVDMMRHIAQSLGQNLAPMASASRFPGGIFTKYPIVEIRLFNHAGPSNQSEPFSRFGGAALLNVEGELLWVANMHAWPHEEAMRAAEAEILGDRLEQLFKISPNMIVTGDFNSPVGATLDRTLVQQGLVNSMGLEWIGSEPTLLSGQSAIDRIYVSSNLVGHVVGGRVIRGPGFYDPPNNFGEGDWLNSDHLPVVVELRWPKSTPTKET